MKTTLSKIFVLALMVLAGACRGPAGPPGLEGPPGPEGHPGPEAEILEYEGIDFRPPAYSVFLDFGFITFSSDAVLVYAQWGTEVIDGEVIDIWRLLPQATFQDDGLLIYNFEHTDERVELFLEADFPIAESSLGPDELDDWVIRVVIIPGFYLTNARTAFKVDINDYQAVKEYYNLKEFPSPKLTHQRPEVKK